MEQEIYSKYIDTPIGVLKLTSNLEALLTISFAEKEEDSSELQPAILNETVLQLKEFFNGERKTFDVNIAPHGTEFQQNIWEHVQLVNFGTTVSYLDIAIKSGSAKNTRAVGLANGKNPIPIIIPCHRIIGSNGKLTGYSGGLERKRWLLQHELQHTSNKNLLF